MAIHIDKSMFSAEELEQYEALIAKATVNPEADPEEEEEVAPPAPKKTKKAEVEDMEDTKKSAPTEPSPELTAALARLETLEKSLEMKEYTEIAKKYAPLGEDETQLAETLYNMKKSNEANYNAYISVLDKSLGMVEKSGLFAEIGKSAPSESGTVEAKVEAKAQELMKSDSSLNYTEAIAKAWDDPALMAEYDAEYHKR